MKTIESYKVNMPEYALCYIHNNDASGIEEADVKAIDEYLQWYYDKAKAIDGHVIIGCSKEEGFFTWHPAFGLACTCIETEILICKEEASNACPSCEASMINGVFCHETGCPEAFKKKTECKWCGSLFIPENRYQECCSEECAESYNS
jgi:hypothetical protein